MSADCVKCRFMQRTDWLAECPVHEMKPKGNGSASDEWRQMLLGRGSKGEKT